MENSEQGKRQYTYKEALGFLTAQQVRILKLIGRGLTCKQIAVLLRLSEKTVKTHRRNIKRKLNLKGYKSLERWCWDNHDAMYSGDSGARYSLSG